MPKRGCSAPPPRRLKYQHTLEEFQQHLTKQRAPREMWPVVVVVGSLLWEEAPRGTGVTCFWRTCRSCSDTSRLASATRWASGFSGKYWTSGGSCGAGTMRRSASSGHAREPASLLACWDISASDLGPLRNCRKNFSARWDRSSMCSGGGPHSRHVRRNWLYSDSPGNSGQPSASSATRRPADQTSIPESHGEARSTSGARYLCEGAVVVLAQVSRRWSGASCVQEAAVDRSSGNGKSQGDAPAGLHI